MTEKTMSNCLRYRDKPKCDFTGKECNNEIVKTCTEYKSDEDYYECPHCNRKGLKLMDYGKDKVWECLRCGAELWYCESVSEMQQRCRELRK